MWAFLHSVRLEHAQKWNMTMILQVEHYNTLCLVYLQQLCSQKKSKDIIFQNELENGPLKPLTRIL